jgi:hypothetical protein
LLLCTSTWRCRRQKHEHDNIFQPLIFVSLVQREKVAGAGAEEWHPVSAVIIPIIAIIPRLMGARRIGNPPNAMTLLQWEFPPGQKSDRGWNGKNQQEDRGLISQGIACFGNTKP